ncbi:MAG: GDP-mannose 4,6-dehydratase [Candidatus Promineofilum sp.]|nr:GDP-mannose 4,6-dehydratase [Promineifilum sp.]
MTILVTGAAGFIGSHLAERLLRRGDTVIGLDNFNDYYDPARKRANERRLCAYDNFRMVEADVRDREALLRLFAAERHPGRGPPGGDGRRARRHEVPRPVRQR